MALLKKCSPVSLPIPQHPPYVTAPLSVSDHLFLVDCGNPGSPPFGQSCVGLDLTHETGCRLETTGRVTHRGVAAVFGANRRFAAR